MLQKTWKCVFKILSLIPLHIHPEVKFAGSCGSSIFNSLKNLYIAFHRGCLRELEREENTKPKVGRRKEVDVKIKAK